MTFFGSIDVTVTSQNGVPSFHSNQRAYTLYVVALFNWGPFEQFYGFLRSM